MQSKLRRRIATSPIARGAAFRCGPWPWRVTTLVSSGARSIGWCIAGRPRTITYDLDPLNRDQLCWFVSAVTGAEIGQVRAWTQELEKDRISSAS